MSRYKALLTGLLAAAVVYSMSPRRALAGEPLDLIPAGSLLCWHGRPLPDMVPLGDKPSTLQTLLDLGSRVAGSKLGQRARIGMRITELLGLTIRHHHAIALIDARAKPTKTDSKSRRVDRLRMVLVVEVPATGEANGEDALRPFLQTIQKTVNEQTNQETATLVTRKAQRWSYQELRDRRLPDWAVIGWGRIGRHFVLSIGPDVWPAIAGCAAGEQPSLSREPWYAEARRVRGHEAPIEVFMAAGEIRRRLDPFVHGRASSFFRAWDAEDLERAHWAIGFEGRALYCLAHFLIRGKTVSRLYADPSERDPHLLATVPPGTRYAICQVPLARFFPRLMRGLLVIQGAKARANIERVWAQMQAECGVDAERDILAHLGNHIVLHNDPPHPLRLPLAMTTLIEIRQEPERVREAIEALSAAWRNTLDKAVIEASHPPPFTVQNDGDGVWYLRFGPLAGPAWTLSDRFIITSWSPHALRDYLAKIGPETSARPAGAARLPRP